MAKYNSWDKAEKALKDHKVSSEKNFKQKCNLIGLSNILAVNFDKGAKNAKN